MITIIADRHRYNSPPSEALLAVGPADYVLIRRHIRAALDQGEPLTVYATDPIVLGWLLDLQSYPETHLTWQVIDPGEEFARLFGILPADPFTPKRIAALCLAELPHPPVGVLVHPVTWILGHRLDPIWQHDDPPPGHAAALAAWALNQTMPLDADLAALAQVQLDRWSAQRQVYQVMHAASLVATSTQLFVRWALQRYDERWNRAQAWGGLPILEGEPPVQALITVLRNQQQPIQAYWNRKITGATVNAAMIDACIEQMSGLSGVELSALLTMIDRCPAALDRQLLQAIRSRFARLPTADADLRTLAAQVAPPEPPMPDPQWSVKGWLDWATRQYMPYYTWVIRTGQERDYQQLCALRYSDWLYEHYPSWLNDACSPLLLSQYQDVGNLIEADAQAVVVWLIVDGMTWWQGDLIREACERHGLYPQEQRPGIAVLPSITSISKRALVTGQPSIDLTQPTIAATARLKLARSNIPAIVGYNFAEVIDDLRERDDLRVAVVLFNTLDILAHQTATLTDNAGIRGYLDDLARNLDDARHVCAERGRRFHVIIGSDHGSTLLPADTMSVSLPNTAREVDDVWEPELPGQEAQRPGTRAAATDLDYIPAIDQAVWYVLDRYRFQLDRHYLVPRGYNYIKRRPSGWTHGGLTPEETIIPLFHLSSEQPSVLPIELELHGSLLPGQPGIITALLRNLNPFPVHGLTLLVSGVPAEATVAQLGPLEQQELELSFAQFTAQGSDLPVRYEVRYNAFGGPQRDEGHARIPLRRLQTEDTAFDDMFS